ncbi:MAG: hypothetical protein PHV05_09965 [Candidatus Riflebacteria bacterium]|nr:hypothetical protein [Candidatus Riflebacteria bacterium]
MALKSARTAVELFGISVVIAGAVTASANFKEANAMMEFISHNLDTVLLIALLGFKLLEFIAPKTETIADDKVVSAINWALQHANSVFNIIDDLSAVGLIKVSKTEAFREELRKQYRKVYGKDLPEAAVSAAENIAAGLAAEDHNIKRLAASVNPQLPPAQ